MAFSHRITRSLAAASLLAALCGCAESPRHESTGQYIDDTTITTKVKAGILNEPSLRELDVSVKTTHGVVELAGLVDSPEAAGKASAIAQNVAGVQGVRNNLKLR